jgi:hypothetical protein
MFKGKTLILAFGIVLVAVGSLFATTVAAGPIPQPVPTPERSLFNEYRGVKIGVKADDVRTRLGAPKDKSDTMDMFAFSDSETAQFYYDESTVVKAIMITFQGDVSKAPTAREIFGEDVAPNADGMIFRMERYPKAGYWISYTRTTGSDAMVNIAMQKM